mgnify:FL=1
MITAGQIKMIHSLASSLAIDEDAYRAALQSRFGVKSSKQMSMEQAGTLIDEWQLEALQQRVWRYRDGDERYSSRSRLGNRNPDMASHKQLIKIDGLWSVITKMEDPKRRQEALRKFVFRIAKVSDPRFLNMRAAQGVIAALLKMQKHYQYDREEIRAAV